MEINDPVYNVKYFQDLKMLVDTDEIDMTKSYEINKLMSKVDERMSNKTLRYLQYIVPFFYNITFMLGSVVFIYKIII